MIDQWRKTPLGEIAKLYDSLHKTPKYSDVGYPMVRVTDIRGGYLDTSSCRLVDEDALEEFSKKHPPAPGDILFSRVGSYGNSTLVTKRERFCLGQNTVCFSVNAEEVIPHFLFAFLNSPDAKAQIDSFVGGASQPTISLGNIKRIETPLPPLTIQRRIASILSAYDDLIENNTRRIAILEEMARQLYEEWFVHFRFPGHEEVNLNSDLPEGWETEHLIDAAHLVMGQSPKSEFYNKTGEGLPFHQGVTNFGDYFPTDRLFCTVTNRLAEEEDILFSVRAPVGRINITTKRIVIGRGVSAIRSNRDNQTFLLCQLRNRFSEEDTMGGGTIFKAVTKKDMETIKLTRPPQQLVTSFEQVVSPMWKQIRRLTEKNTNLRTQRNLLLPKLISGEIDVSDTPSPDGEEQAA